MGHIYGWKGKNETNILEENFNTARSHTCLRVELVGEEKDSNEANLPPYRGMEVTQAATVVGLFSGILHFLMFRESVI